MKVTTERQGGALSICVDGRIDGSNVVEFEEAVRAAIGDEDVVVIMDFGNLLYVSSAGLRAVLLTGKRLRGRKSELVLCSLSDPIRKVFEISGFDKLFAIHPTRGEALSSLAD